MYATRRYRSYSTFRSKARGKYTGRNRRRTKYRYRRRRTSRRLPFYRQAYRRRRVKRRGKWKQTGLVRNPTSQAFTLSAETFNSHSCTNVAPSAADIDVDGANQWVWFKNPWLHFYFNETSEDVPNSDKYEGPLKGTKILRLWQRTTIRLRPTFVRTTKDTLNELEDIAAGLGIAWSVRVIWFTWKQGSFDTIPLLGGSAVQSANIPTKILGLADPAPPEKESGNLFVLNWCDFIGNVNPVTQPMANMRASYTKNHAGVFRIFSDRTYRFTGLKERIIKKTFGRAIVDFNASAQDITSDPLQHRSHRYSCMLVFDVRQVSLAAGVTLSPVPIKMFDYTTHEFKYSLF